MNKKVGCFSVKKLFAQNLCIPTYQRPYLWSKNQVEDLLNDFLEIFESNESKIYLIGNMIFYKNKDNLEIVDGQQRTITLALLLYNLYNLEDNITKNFLEKINVSNPLSKKAIYDNNEIIKNYIDRFFNDRDKKDSFLTFIKNNILVTYIIAQTQDEAFIFFDSQNTRGKPLNRHDLLKAHHLRDKNLNSEKRVIYAKKWEEYDENELKRVLEIYLTLSRNFVKGNYKFDIDVYEEFKSNNFTTKLNNYNQPPIFQNIHYDIKSDKLKLIISDEIEIKIGNGLVIENGKKYLPFEILQSIGGGEEFFWYVFKYMELKKDFDEILDKEVSQIVEYLSTYLQEYFYAITFLYFDKFGNKKFDEFSYLILWLISHYRLNHYAVKHNGVRNFIKDYNIFAKLFFSYSVDEIINKIYKMIKYEFSEIDAKELNNSPRKEHYKRIKENKKLNEIANLVKDNDNVK